MNPFRKNVRLACRLSRWAVVIAILGLGGCFPTPGVNIADEFGEYAGFCGFLQDCGSHGDPGERGANENRGDEDDEDSGPPASGAAAPTGT